MLLTPRYGNDPVIHLDGNPAAIAAPAIRQRERLLATVQGFTDDDWAQPTRCEGWTARDVILHLDSTNTFWNFAISAGLQGEPTTFLTTFDPVTSPPQHVSRVGDISSAEVLDRFRASTSALVELWRSLDDGAWTALAEAPPGHIAVNAVTHHALWDSWIHERDILLPRGVGSAEEDDEVTACLRYVAALGPAFALNRGIDRTGAMAITASSPDTTVLVEIGSRVDVSAGPATAADLHLRGDAVDLVESLSVRSPLRQPIPAEHAWILRGLTETFDVS